MLKVVIQEKPYSIPNSINDISIGRFIEFRNLDPHNDLELIYWLLNDNPNFKQDDTVEIALANVLSMTKPCIDEIYDFMNNKAKNETPTHIEVLGQDFELKKGLLNDLPYWPYVVTKAMILKELEKDVFDPTDSIPMVLAHYLYEFVTKKTYSERKANEFIEIVNDLPMVQSIKLGNFFLNKHKDLFPSKKNNSKQMLTLVT